MVGIAGARPVAERHRGRDAGLARINYAAVLGGEAAQVEHFDLEAARFRDDLACNHHQPPGLRHFTWTGLVAA